MSLVRHPWNVVPQKQPKPKRFEMYYNRYLFHLGRDTDDTVLQRQAGFRLCKLFQDLSIDEIRDFIEEGRA